jgi:hypothetical protein
MKKVALVIAFTLLAALRVSAAESATAPALDTAAPAMTPAQPAGETAPLFMAIGLLPRCYTIDGTSCTTAGSTKACTDACHNSLSCTCYKRYGGTYGTTYLGSFWSCNVEC